MLQIWLNSLLDLQSYFRLPRLSWQKLLASLILNLFLFGVLFGVTQSLSQIPEFFTAFQRGLKELTAELPEQIKISWDKQALTIEPSDWKQLNPFASWRESYQYLFIYQANQLEPSEFSATLPGTTLAILTPTTVYWHDGLTWQKQTLAEILVRESGSLDRAGLVASINKASDELTRNRWLIQLVWPLLVGPMLIISHLVTLGLDIILVWLINRINSKRFEFRWLAQVAVYLSFWARIGDQLVKTFSKSSDWPTYSLLFWLSFSLIVISFARQHESPLRPGEKPVAGWAD